MSAKLDKIGADWKRALKKAEEWAAKAKELERRYKEEENTEIHTLVHEAQLNPDQLAEVLKALKAGVFPSPAIVEDVMGSPEIPENESESEFEEDEQNED